MPKAILSINAGSSSVKVSAYEVDENDRRPEQIVEMQVAGLTAPPASFSYQSRSRSIKHQPLPDQVSSQEDAFRFLLDKLVDDAEGAQVIKRKEDIEVACHRVVHGGGYDREQIITAETYHHLEGLTELAPLYVALSKLTYKNSAWRSDIFFWFLATSKVLSH
jgi:acetate kinase